MSDIFQPDAALLPLLPVDPDHKLFTVSGTAYMRNLSREQMNGKWIAVHYQDPPKRTERGHSRGLRFPTLIIADYVEDAQALADKVAAILNQHWSESEAAHG